MIVLNPSGTLHTKYSYTDYGVRDSGYDVLNTSSNPIGYTGEYLEPTGLLYLRARYYDPYTSTFISEDIYHGILYDPSSRNRYSYGRRNPKKYVDPSGHWPQWLNNAWDATKTFVTNVYNGARNIVTNVYNAGKAVYNTYLKPAVQTVTRAITATPKTQPQPSNSARNYSNSTSNTNSYSHSSGRFGGSVSS